MSKGLSMRELAYRKKKKQNKFFGRGLAPLDVEILQFIWKWRRVPASCLHLAVAPSAKPDAFNRRLKKLEKHDYLDTAWEPRYRRRTWILGPRAEEILSDLFPNIEGKGFGSPSPAHDHLVLAFAMGEWIFNQENRPEYFTEQMITQLDPATRPPWLSQSLNERIPDCLLRFQKDGRERVFALEVELNAKSQARYEGIMRAYKNDNKITRVIWLYRDPYIVEQIQKAIKEIHMTTKNFVVFVDEKDFNENMWNATVINECSENIGFLGVLYRGQQGLEAGEFQGTTPVFRKITDVMRPQKFVKR
jgi:hypothetical protein